MSDDIDAPVTEEERRLFQMARSLVSGLRLTYGFSPADVAIVMATAIGVTLGKSDNNLTDETIASIIAIIRGAFDGEREISQSPPQPQ